MTPALLLIIAALAAVVLWQWIRESSIWQRANAEWRCAVDFVIETRVRAPSDFLALFRDGNHQAIQEHYPDFATFREHWLDREDEEA